MPFDNIIYLQKKKLILKVTLNKIKAKAENKELRVGDTRDCDRFCRNPSIRCDQEREKREKRRVSGIFGIFGSLPAFLIREVKNV